MDITPVLEERGLRYGRFADNSAIAQMLKDVMHKSPNWDKLPMDFKEALDMNASKISRMLCGDWEWLDNPRDIIGFWSLVINDRESSSSSEG